MQLHHIIIGSLIIIWILGIYAVETRIVLNRTLLNLQDVSAQLQEKKQTLNKKREECEQKDLIISLRDSEVFNLKLINEKLKEDKMVIHEIRQTPMDVVLYEGSVKCDEDFDDFEYIKTLIGKDLGERLVKEDIVTISQTIDYLTCQKIYCYSIHVSK